MIMPSVTPRLSFFFLLIATCLNARGQFIIDLSKEKLDLPDCGIQVDSVVVASNI